MKEIVYIVLGCIGVGLGTVGALIPILPTVPFLMVSAFCFANSSEKLHKWFIGTSLYKNNLQSFVQKRAMTLKTKIRIILIVTATMSIGFIAMSNVPVGRIVLVVVWLFHLVYFSFSIKTIKK